MEVYPAFWSDLVILVVGFVQALVLGRVAGRVAGRADVLVLIEVLGVIEMS